VSANDYDPLTDEHLVDIAAYRGRLAEFCRMANLKDLEGQTVVAVGAALGGEVIASFELGAKEVIGLEVDQALVERATQILMNHGLSECRFATFDGVEFPEIGPVDIVLSGHVIEHTPDPVRHLRDCLKILRPSGLLFLEFPSRFHWRELHTGRIGFEWMPTKLRGRANRIAGLAAERMGDEDARGDHETINATLRQVSTWNVSKWLREDDCGRIVARQVPRRGIVRLCIRKARR
jgi:SAM-dependent methyltransferase